MPSSSLWQRFQRYFLYYRDLDFSLDISRLKFDADPEEVFHVLRHLASNDPHIRVAPGEAPSEDRFSVGQEC